MRSEVGLARPPPSMHAWIACARPACAPACSVRAPSPSPPPSSEMRTLAGRLACRSMLSRDARVRCRRTSARSNCRTSPKMGSKVRHGALFSKLALDRARSTSTSSTASGTVAWVPLLVNAARKGRCLHGGDATCRCVPIYASLCVPTPTCCVLPPAHERRAPCAESVELDGQ